MSVLLAFLSLVLESQTGYPDRLYKAIGHPVSWIGSLISSLDRLLNRPAESDRRRRLYGVLALVAIVGLPAAIAGSLEFLLSSYHAGLAVLVIAGSTLLSQQSLAEHVKAVAEALETDGLAGGREAVSKIVGRDPEQLDEAGISRAAIESLAENFSDGIVAPAFWLALGGLAGGVAYKAANTADSMIGHLTPTHRAFGWAAARFDDLVNLPASRIAALLLVAAAALTPGADAGAAWQAVLRDAGKHRSPNAGWPESAMAGALGLELAGPRVYSGKMVRDAFMGEGGRRIATAADIRRALKLFWLADLLLIGLLGLAALLFLLL
ncbi:MAG: adenosylcobinamide-phosphate synthase CbiB [Alphaproteobacteria bacterium]|nr:adenosylcobinamide-phosphate synthase CbiB [Alphaproteobacteria bacterium]MBU0802230.1 adenosylcobinamide-phosphate synthase CbiB [Alphaproteobacteria bacterium]MBU0870328.1 adenosylcobinamide-phosphate synthase CbiB [Alphaproteobacteria bacterium]MBU1399729.1 adenosylcobinamide-phosphate synthase CbiB [Alphaproteobacteria bacterium]MBU1590115.1 adenosylcobinamide-phosphate synthase CbiB [Alphaproteobacteria bacterium]